MTRLPSVPLASTEVDAAPGGNATAHSCSPAGGFSIPSAMWPDFELDRMLKRAAAEDARQRCEAAEREAMVLARIDATIRRSPLSAPLWLEVTVDRNSRISRAVYAVGVWLLIATAAALAGSLLGKAATNNAETLRQIEDGRAAW